MTEPLLKDLLSLKQMENRRGERKRTGSLMLRLKAGLRQKDLLSLKQMENKRGERKRKERPKLSLKAVL